MTVIDASAVAAVAFLEQQADAVRDAIAGIDLVAPRLLPFELANIARNKMRQRPEAAPVLAEQLRVALAMPVTLQDVDYHEVCVMATAHDLTAYDASYLWLARRLAAPLVTLDGDLAKAMSQSTRRSSEPDQEG